VVDGEAGALAGLVGHDKGTGTRGEKEEEEKEKKERGEGRGGGKGGGGQMSAYVCSSL